MTSQTPKSPGSYQEVVFGEKAHEELLKGATILARAVRSTMGPGGHSVIIDTGDKAPTITKDGVTVARSINLQDRLQSLGAELLKEVANKTNEISGDGPQPKYAKVLTPHGWTTMGNLRVGDVICGTNGTQQKILGIYDKGVKDIYRITLADGHLGTRSVECSEEHLWSVNTSYDSRKIMTTKQMLDSGLKQNNGGGRYFIKPTCVEFANSEELPIDPYLLGVLLGDGSLSRKHEVEIAVGLKEGYILDKLKLPEGCWLRKRYYTNKKHYIKATISGSVSKKGLPCQGQKSIIKNKLNELGLLGTDSYTKFIPKSYLFSSEANRRLLLEGLIDTDGFINDRGLFEFGTVSKQLYLDFIELCRSLGIALCSKEKIRKPGNGSFSTRNIYRVAELKGNKCGLKIKNIEKLNKQTEMMCIKVSNADHLYITDDFVPTHNTTSATVLGHGLLSQGIKMIASGRSSTELKKGIDIACLEVLEFLKENCIPISQKEDIVSVGTISANGDRSIGELLADAIEKVGSNGIITVEPAKSVNTYLELAEGTQVDSGYVSPFFVTNKEKLTCELNDPVVLITNKKISALEDIIGVLELVHQAKKSLLIIADDIEGEALHTLIVNKMKNVINVCAIKAPSFGENRSDILQDISTVCGGTVFDVTSEKTLKHLKSEDLGSCKKIIVGRNATTIVVGQNPQTKQKLEEKIKSLQSALVDGTLDDLRVDRYRKRLAKLSGGVAIVRVGGSTEIEIMEKKDRVDDALNATIAASQEGIVPGGGTALFYAAIHLRKKLAENKDWKALDEDIAAGIQVVANTCEMPLITIVENAGASSSVVMQKLKEHLTSKKISLKKQKVMDIGGIGKTFDKKNDKRLIEWTNPLLPSDVFIKILGYDASKHEYGDLVAKGIIDPVKVTRYALEHACSIVGLMLTCDSVIVTNTKD